MTTTRLLSALACAALVLGLTTACQSPAPDIGADQATAFQSRVLTVSTSVADGGYAAALEELTALESELDAAAADGTVSFARHQRIEAALVLVRADIQAAIAAQTPAAPTETVAPVAPVEESDDAPDEETDEETDAEKKAREATEKAAKKAQEEADKAAKKAEEELKKAEEKAKKDAENGED